FVFPGEIYFFTENPNSNNYYEYSRGSDAGNSYVEMAGPSNDKFPVDSDHPHQGFHALRLQWRSSTLGDWEIGVASYQWTVHDLTQYDSIQYWINAPQAIAAADLPDLALEDANNHKSTRVGLGNFLAGIDADTTTWQKVSIPINAFSPGPQNCDFTRIKFIFHLQKQLDNVTHTVWIDEVKAIGPGGGSPPGRPTGLTATGYDSRIDLKWIPGNNPDLLGYYVYRSSTAGTFNRINAFPHSVHIYSDFFGQNNQTHSYYITAVNRNFQESPPSDTVSATSSAMTTEELITSVQEATFRYFLDHAHPISGMARERKGSGDVCATGGTGFGLMAMVVGVERGFVSRGFAAGRVLQILRFLQDNATRYHGAWSHWIN
ncbi:MAG: hypothetical protein GWN14_11705, partial [candidate division Zixibacteria bacterium]|nr:hypothetical protein [Gammaproteobacteria bacterium]NIX56556.1 hypothetical protein [candidate division Zixibacteria bacterium]